MNILFLCTGNSCRSQMAEGWLRELRGADFSVFSAGVEKHGLNPRAVAVMAEAGVDISRQQSQTLDDTGLDFDLVVTVCDHAAEVCPVFPGKAKVLHHSFDDPPGLTRDEKDEKKILPAYRRVRDEIKAFVEELPVDP